MSSANSQTAMVVGPMEASGLSTLILPSTKKARKGPFYLLRDKPLRRLLQYYTSRHFNGRKYIRLTTDHQSHKTGTTVAETTKSCPPSSKTNPNKQQPNKRDSSPAPDSAASDALPEIPSVIFTMNRENAVEEKWFVSKVYRLGKRLEVKVPLHLILRENENEECCQSILTDDVSADDFSIIIPVAEDDLVDAEDDARPVYISWTFSSSLTEERAEERDDEEIIDDDNNDQVSEVTDAPEYVIEAKQDDVLDCELNHVLAKMKITDVYYMNDEASEDTLISI